MIGTLLRFRRFRKNQEILIDGKKYNSWELYREKFPNHLGSVGVGKCLDTDEFLTEKDFKKAVEAIDEKYGSTAYEEGLYRAKHCSIFIKTSKNERIQIRNRSKYPVDLSSLESLN
jgi:hypothetical protein